MYADTTRCWKDSTNRIWALEVKIWLPFLRVILSKRSAKNSRAYQGIQAKNCVLPTIQLSDTEAVGPFNREALLLNSVSLSFEPDKKWWKEYRIMFRKQVTTVDYLTALKGVLT